MMSVELFGGIHFQPALAHFLVLTSKLHKNMHTHFSCRDCFFCILLFYAIAPVRVGWLSWLLPDGVRHPARESARCF